MFRSYGHPGQQEKHHQKQHHPDMQGRHCYSLTDPVIIIFPSSPCSSCCSCGHITCNNYGNKYKRHPNHPTNPHRGMKPLQGNINIISFNHWTPPKSH